MRFFRFVFLTLLFTFLTGCGPINPNLQIKVSRQANPWTNLKFNNKSKNFEFAIVSDRTGSHRPDVFKQAVYKLNLLQPEFVLGIGDLIEGYTEDIPELNHQWNEFSELVNLLEMPFFYVAGNHDLSNKKMIAHWQKRFGRSYYHFIYHNVLFLVLNTNDLSAEYPGLSQEQVNYFRNVLIDNPHVDYTFIFLHYPLWRDDNDNNWVKFETLLFNRKYSVFAGHVHTYSKLLRQGHNYYTLATTGGSSELGGYETGQYDQIILVNMFQGEPRITNLGLDCIHDDRMPKKSETNSIKDND